MMLRTCKMKFGNSESSLAHRVSLSARMLRYQLRFFPFRESVIMEFLDHSGILLDEKGNSLAETGQPQGSQPRCLGRRSLLAVYTYQEIARGGL